MKNQQKLALAMINCIESSVHTEINIINIYKKEKS